MASGTLSPLRLQLLETCAGVSSSSVPAAAGTAAKAEGEEEEGPPEFKAEVQLAAGAKLLFKEPAKLFIRNTAKVRSSALHCA